MSSETTSLCAGTSVSSLTSNGTSSSSSKTRSYLEKSIRFGQVEIRDMPMELGEHPPTQGGAPVTIGWNAMSVRKIPVDLYEVHRSDFESRKGDSLKMDASERAQILLDAGYSINELALAAEAAGHVLKQRSESLSSQKMEFLHVATESARRKFARAVGIAPKPSLPMAA